MYNIIIIITHRSIVYDTLRTGDNINYIIRNSFSQNRREKIENVLSYYFDDPKMIVFAVFHSTRQAMCIVYLYTV